MAATSASTYPPSFTPGPADPPSDLRNQEDRDAWLGLDINRYMEMCTHSTVSGNLDYVEMALQASHETVATFVDARVAAPGSDEPELTAKEAFGMLQLQQK